MIQVPALSITHPSIHQVVSKPLEKLTSVSLGEMCKPIIFNNAKQIFADMKGGSDEFFKSAKNAAAEKKQAIGRVTDNNLGAAMSAKITDIVKDYFVTNAEGTGNDDLKGQMVVGPCLPDEYEAAHDGHVKSVMSPAWWATGPHHETTNFEAHKMGI